MKCGPWQRLTTHLGAHLEWCRIILPLPSDTTVCPLAQLQEILVRRSSRGLRMAFGPPYRHSLADCRSIYVSVYLDYQRTTLATTRELRKGYREILHSRTCCYCILLYKLVGSQTRLFVILSTARS